MGLAFDLARKNLTRRPSRSLFAALGIALGIATVVGVFTLDHNTVAGLKKRYAPFWRPEIEVRAQGELSDPRAELEAIAGVDGVAAFFEYGVVLSPDTPAENLPQNLFAVLFAADSRALPDLGGYRIDVGRHIDPAAEREVLVGPEVAAVFELRPGDTLWLSPPDRAARQACIDGVLETLEDPPRAAPPRLPFEVVGILTPEMLGRRTGGEIVIIDYAAGRALYSDARVDSRYWVKRDPAVDLENLQADLATNFAYDVSKGAVIGQLADERAFRNGVRMAGLLALVLGLYVIFHTLSMSLVERISEIGTMHALGTSRAQIARTFFCEAILLAGLGGALGLAGGLGLARGALMLGITTLGSGRNIATFEVPWPAALGLTAAGVMVALLGSVYPLFRARSASSVAVLRGESSLEAASAGRGFAIFAALLLVGLLPGVYFVISPVVGAASGTLLGTILLAVGVLGLLIVVPLLVPSLLSAACLAISRPFQRLWPFAGHMAALSISHSGRRISVSTSAVTLVVAAFVGLKSMTRTLRGEVDLWAQEAVIDKVYVRDLPPIDYAALRDHLADYPQVIGIEAGSARTRGSFLMLGLNVEDLSGYGPVAEDPELGAALAAGRGMILSERLANNFELAVGDTVPVSTGDGRINDFSVLAISDAYGYFPHPDERMYAVIGERDMRRYFCLDNQSPDPLALRLAEGSDPDLARAALLAFLADSSRGAAQPHFETGRELRARQIADIDRDFLLFDLILALTALLATLGVLNGQLLAALERFKELGVLKALGASRSQLAGMVWLESTVIGLLGGALGLGLGLCLGPVVVGAIEALSGLDLPYRHAGSWIVVALGGALVASLAAGAFPVWRMNHDDPVRAVRTG